MARYDMKEVTGESCITPWGYGLDLDVNTVITLATREKYSTREHLS